MTQTVRLVATDLDGTLLRSDRTVSDYTRATIAAAQDAGITIVIATARHPSTARLFAAEAGIKGLAICANGALVYDLTEEKVVAQTHLPAAIAQVVIERLRAGIPDICFALVQGMDFACEPAYAAIARADDHGRELADVLQGDALRMLETPLTKLIVRHPDLAPVALLERLSTLEINGYEASLSGAPFLDVVASGVSKAAALATICQGLNVSPHEVVAFGDAPNDLPMLRWAGRPIVVANAFPEVIAAIPESTASNDEDGVARAVADLLS